MTGGVANAAAALGVVAPPPNAAPVVTITSPTANASFATGAAITFTGSASDAEDGNRTATLVWTSSLQGQIGTGGTFTVSTLNAGTHVITARATDTANLAGTTTRTITVVAPAPPTAPNTLRVTRSGSTVTSSWRDRSNNETGFQVRREQRINNIWVNQTVLATTAANVTSYANTGVTAGTYRYSVRAVNGSAASAWTGWVTITVP